MWVWGAVPQGWCWGHCVPFATPSVDFQGPGMLQAAPDVQPPRPGALSDTLAVRQGRECGSLPSPRESACYGP